MPFYLPLSGPAGFLSLGTGRGAAVKFAPGIAVTNAHNANLIAPGAVIGQSSRYDLLFFRVGLSESSPPMAQPQKGEAVIAYGQGRQSEMRQAEGVVTEPAVSIPAECAGCGTQQAFIFAADGGKGFSGGPVVDAFSGKLVGVVFAFKDDAGGRLMYAYDMAHVVDQYERVKTP